MKQINNDRAKGIEEEGEIEIKRNLLQRLLVQLQRLILHPNMAEDQEGNLWQTKCPLKHIQLPQVLPDMKEILILPNHPFLDPIIGEDLIQ